MPLPREERSPHCGQALHSPPLLPQSRTCSPVPPPPKTHLSQERGALAPSPPPWETDTTQSQTHTNTGNPDLRPHPQHQTFPLAKATNLSTVENVPHTAGRGSRVCSLGENTDTCHSALIQRAARTWRFQKDNSSHSLLPATHSMPAQTPGPLRADLTSTSQTQTENGPGTCGILGLPSVKEPFTHKLPNQKTATGWRQWRA